VMGLLADTSYLVAAAIFVVLPHSAATVDEVFVRIACCPKRGSVRMVLSICVEGIRLQM